MHLGDLPSCGFSRGGGGGVWGDLEFILNNRQEKMQSFDENKLLMLFVCAWNLHNL